MQSYEEFEDSHPRESKRDRLPRRRPERREVAWSEELRPATHKGGSGIAPIRKAIGSELRELFGEATGFRIAGVRQLFDAKRGLMNHVLLADLLNRLSGVGLKRDDTLRSDLAALGTQVLAELLSDRVRPGPREITTAWRATEAIGIQDNDLLEELARRTKRVLHAFDALDFRFAIAGLASVQRPSPSIASLLASVCAAFRCQIPEAAPDSVLAVLIALGRSGCTDPGLARDINASLVEQGQGGALRMDALTLHSMAALVRCNAELRLREPLIFSRVTEHFRRAFLQGNGDNRALPGTHGAADYVWAGAAAGYTPPQDLLAALESHILAGLPLIQNPESALACSIVAIPALLVARNGPSAESFKRFHDLESMERAFSGDSSFEKNVAYVLDQSLGLSFQREFRLGPYSLDFLITLPGGRRVNLETDGDHHHLMRNVASNTLERSYLGRDVVRDRVLQLFGLETVRILGSEWNMARDKAELLRERLSGGQQ